MPLQVGTVPFTADQRRVAQMPPLPPITKEQISNGELMDLLEESDYGLTTMVIKYILFQLPAQSNLTKYSSIQQTLQFFNSL